MEVANKIAICSLMLATVQMSGCTSHNAEPQRLIMRNPASEWCLQRGGKLVQEASSSGSALYCVLPSGEKIKQWALFHRDHSK
ncbi:putative hemolysin [Pantoea eucalypti]|jgi:hypothetical protein|uniref:putative hemolysin n=1 Tax=Pantoea TaxID=53335 RepID=UPI0001E0E826|nr:MULTISPECIES: DUF333 domain-containing protein [Pantoea]EFM18096.1 protein of unknown function DUF333 [Pantoea sp. aB]MBD9554376.1 DUF333 domain-containing protein [Pantoea sp. PNT01]QNQ61122.1 DUF333 domain-containing protein [Pantoea sp. MT58]